MAPSQRRGERGAGARRDGFELELLLSLLSICTRTVARTRCLPALFSPPLFFFRICQLNQRSECKMQHLGKLCGFVALPGGLWVHEAMNGL